MILVVAGVSTLIHLYSIAYLDSDRGYTRFFAYLNFFVFSMLLLVLAGNFLLLIVGWAFVGAASYMLISFWYRRTTATKRASRRSSSTSLGDVGLVLGTYFIFKHVGTLDFLKTFEKARARRSSRATPTSPRAASCCSSARSRSPPRSRCTHGSRTRWRARPRSRALIHAATMVTAGVYLIARMHPLFELAPTAADVGAVIGCLTLLIAGTIALAVTDLKRVIAYSTMSQIGYMIMAVSAGAYAAGLFHLMTHAFFKALLFMAAGSVIAAMAGQQDLDKMGGFRKAMPFTYGCMVIGGLALAGHPAVLGLLLQGRDPAAHRRSRRLVLGPLRRRLRRRVPDRDLHVPDDLPRLLGRPRARGASSSRRATCTTPRSTRTPPTARSRTPTSASPAPTTTSPSASAR